MFNEIIFWCEFPEEIEWSRLNALLKDRSCRIFFTARSREEYLLLAKKVKAPHVRTGVWPVLSLDEGYWFSGFTARKDIEKLREFAGIPMKVDIEPPFPGKEYTLAKAVVWLVEFGLMKKARNAVFLKETLRDLAQEGEVIVSGFALPEWFRRRYGDPVRLKTVRRNFIAYSTFGPGIWLYMKHFLRKKPEDLVAIGLANHGIFGNEPEYRSLDEFESDVEKLKELQRNHIVVYSLEGILKRPDADEWLRVLFE